MMFFMFTKLPFNIGMKSVDSHSFPSMMKTAQTGTPVYRPAGRALGMMSTCVSVLLKISVEPGTSPYPP